MDLEKLSFNGIGHEKFVDSVQTVCQFISGVTNTPPGTDEHRLGLMLTGITIMPLHDSLGKFHDTLMEERKYLQKESAVKHSERDMQTN